MRGEALRWGRRWAAGVAVMGVLAAGVLALGGCTADADAEPGPSVSTSGSPTVSASPSQSPIVAPVRPAEMERSDEVGALAAAEYFMELFAYVMATGDVVEWDAVSDPSCGFCANVRTDASDIFGAGGSYRGGAFSLTAGEVVGFDPTFAVHAVQFRYTADSATVLNGDGSMAREIPASDGYLVLDVGYLPTGWVLVTGGARTGPVVPS